MQTADVLLSEASSTWFEFVALDKPVIVCNFFKLKWSYRGLFRYRFEKRFGKDNVPYEDIGLHVDCYGDLRDAIPANCLIRSSTGRAASAIPINYVGATVGKASERSVEYLENSGG